MAAQEDVLGALTCASFAPHLNTPFLIRPAAAPPLRVELVSATVLRARPGADLREPFALLFRGPREPWLTQGTYPVEHETLGTFPLFLVPIGPDEQGMRYEAVFG